MKTFILFAAGVLFIILLSNSINAQPSGFEQVYTFSNPSRGTSVIEAADGYVFGGYGPSEMYVIKTGFDGKLQWMKEFPQNTTWSKNDLSKSIISSSDGGFLAVKTTEESGIPKIELLKLNSTGDVEWQKTYGDSSNQFGNTLLKNSEGGYYVIGGMNPGFNGNGDSFGQAIMVKTDDQGNEIRKNYYSFPSITDRGYLLQEFNDSILVLAHYNGALVINVNGEINGQIQSYPGVTALDIFRDSLIVLGRGGKLTAYDLNGNTVWYKSGVLWVNDLQNLDDEGFLISQSREFGIPKLMRLNSTRQVIWQKEINGTVNDIIETSGHELVLAGDYYSDTFEKDFFWIHKTDSLGNYKYLSLISPFNDLHGGDTYNIAWINEGSSQINIDFSIDGGGSWENIAESYPASEEKFPWLIPYSYSDSCLLKITDSSDPLIYDMNDSLFSIIQNSDYNYIAINEIKMWIGNNGDGSHSPSSEAQGFFWPGGVNATQGAIAEDGLVWAGMVNGQLKAGGSYGNHGLQPGNILEDGSPADPNDPRFKIWKSRIDWEQLPTGPEKDAYAYDYNNWPVDLGAPWVDEDGDGMYTPGVDHPKYIGDEILFFAANDLDTTLTNSLYGTDPIGLEVQCEVFGFNSTNRLKDAVFKKYKLINRSGSEINDMYLSYYTDDELGGRDDDFTGVDTSLNLGYTWNGYPDDPVYGTPPPAVGHLIVQPPVAAGMPTDSARYGDGWKKGYKNLPVTAFMLYINGSAVYHDPETAEEINNNMKGLVWDGQPIIDPWILEASKFVVPGDPITGIGWYEGSGWPSGPAPGDHRYLITSGPFNLAAEDTQEIGIAIFMARGDDYFQSITSLRQATVYLQRFYNGALVTDTEDKPETPSKFSLEQNYPNPFNPVTIIKYTLQQQAKVKLKVFDILGREVTTLVNSIQESGRHNIDFNASSLASGVYFYRIEAVPVNGQSGNFVQTKKMVLLK